MWKPPLTPLPIWEDRIRSLSDVTLLLWVWGFLRPLDQGRRHLRTALLKGELRAENRLVIVGEGGREGGERVGPHRGSHQPQAETGEEAGGDPQEWTLLLRLVVDRPGQFQHEAEGEVGGDPQGVLPRPRFTP